MWSAFRQFLAENPPDPEKETRLAQTGGRMCRAGMFGIKDRISLEKMGLDDRVGVGALKAAGGPGMTARLVAGLAGIDIVRQLYLYYSALEPTPGASREWYLSYDKEVVDVIARPTAKGWVVGTLKQSRHCLISVYSVDISMVIQL